ncbi:MAG: hypothetical protein JWL77_3088 [Chthonomonadaceae bacterium]|nr:hypothetical protein [Chthonomonadaceae bacterium]
MDASYPSTVEQHTIDADAAWSCICDYIQANTDALLRGCRAYVRSFGLAAGGQDPGEIAVEILSETAIRAKTSAASYDPARPAHPWLMKIALRVAQDRMGKDQTRREHETSIEQQVNNLFDLASDPQQHVAISDATETILSPLKPEDREIVRMVAIEGWDMQAVGNYMGMLPATVRQRYHRALQRLRSITPEPRHFAQEDQEGTK